MPLNFLRPGRQQRCLKRARGHVPAMGSTPSTDKTADHGSNDRFTLAGGPPGDQHEPTASFACQPDGCGGRDCWSARAQPAGDRFWLQLLGYRAAGLRTWKSAVASAELVAPKAAGSVRARQQPNGEV